MRYSSSAEHALVELCCEVPNRILLIQPQPASCLGIGMSRLSHRRLGGIAGRHESALPASGFHDSRALQFPVGPGHGVRRQSEVTGVVAHGGQASSRQQVPIPDGIDHCQPQLVE